MYQSLIFGGIFLTGPATQNRQYFIVITLMTRFVLLTLVSLFSGFAGFAQSASRQIQKADASFRDMAYALAIGQYESILRKEKNLAEADMQHVRLYLADAYYQVKDFQGAEKNYAEVLNNNPVLKGEEIKAYLRYAQVLSSNGKREESARVWKKYSELQEQDKRGEQFLKLYSNIEALTRNASSYKIDYIGINTASADFSPAYYKNGLVFVSNRGKSGPVRRVFSWDNSSFLDLYYLEDLKVLGDAGSQAATTGSSSQADEAVSRRSGASEKLGSDYYTPPTANDAPTIAHQGSVYINGSRDYEEQATIETKKFSKALNSKYHEGPSTFFHDGSKIIFTRNGNAGGGGIFSQKKDVIARLKLYIADKKGNDWGNIRELPFNSSDYSCGHPTISFDDKILYFVSDMPGGYGGTDIYYTRFENGEWSKPVNLGGGINTAGNEMFPFVDEAGGLYFSSDGHPGLGGLDLFYARVNSRTVKVEGPVRNLGAPLNSDRDDFGIISDAERKTGFFSSNRKRGGADDDIYRFTRSGSVYGCRDLLVSIFDKDSRQPLENIRFEYTTTGERVSPEHATTNAAGTIRLCLEADAEFRFVFGREGYITETRTFSNKEASDFEPSRMEVYLKAEEQRPAEVVKTETAPKEIRLVQKRRSTDDAAVFRGVITGGESGEPMAAVKVRFINKCNGQVQEMYTRKDGSYEFNRDINCDYELTAMKEGFGMSSEVIEKLVSKTLFRKKVKPANTVNLFDTKLYRVGDVVKLENIYYDSDSWRINASSARELDKLSAILRKYPNMIIEISSHTDTRGNADENMRLSQNRAGEVLNYLVKKGGVARERIRSVGKGETEPLNECSDGVQCTEAEHRRNRRTEFKILYIEKK